MNEQVEKMRALVREFDMGQAAQQGQDLAYGILRGEAGKTIGGSPGNLNNAICGPPPVRGLCQEAAEIQAYVSRMETLLATLRERMFGPVPTGAECEGKRGQSWSMSELLANSRVRLFAMCEEFELLISKME